MKRTLSLLALSALAASTSLAELKLEPVATDLSHPLWATGHKSAPRYLYILEKEGLIKILDQKTGKLLPQPFLDIRDKIRIRMNEQGLLCMDFDPQFAKNGKFYLNYTDHDGTTRIARYTCNPALPTVADAASEEILMTISQDYRNHNGGWIGFGPDNYLYIAMGDGGSANDPKNRARDMSQHLGKLLRIDVSGAKGYTVPKSNPYVGKKDVKPEIYAFGLRNPWRCSWDPLTKDFYVADVGQNKIEEINFIPGNDGAGADYGWRLREGEIRTPKKGVGGDATATQTKPIYSYAHGMGSDEGLSVTGGFVYRGKIKSLQGHYLFADWINPRIWSFQAKQNKATNFKDWTDTLELKKHKINRISSFGRDAQGELYVIEHKLGSIFKIVDK